MCVPVLGLTFSIAVVPLYSNLFFPFAVAALSKLETLGSEMSRVATMELVDFWDFLEMLIVQVFQRFKKKISLKVHVCMCPNVCTSR